MYGGKNIVGVTSDTQNIYLHITYNKSKTGQCHDSGNGSSKL